MKFLGETLDIHTGGIDLAFPHHENEIAQSEAATGKHFVKYWLHAEHLLVEGEKMSKSLGNFYTLRDLFAKGFKPSALRFALASVPYRRQLNFTFDGLAAGRQLRRAPEKFRRSPGAREISAVARKSCAEKYARAHRQKPPKNSTPDSPTISTPRARLAPSSNSCAKPTSPWTKANSRQVDVAAAQKFLQTFDQVFAVLENNDARETSGSRLWPGNRLRRRRRNRKACRRAPGRPPVAATSPPPTASVKNSKNVV